MEIFHYCNLSKLESILQSKKLWLTPVQTMNDDTEVDHLYNVVFPKVKEQIIKETLLDLLNNVETVFHYVESNAKLHIASMPYCVCFSDEGDLLSQWQRYADDGTGVSIGFDIDYFNIKNEPPHPNSSIKNSIGLETVIYDYNLQASILYSIFKQNLSHEIPNSSYWITILNNMTRYSAIFKNRTFYAEREKRIIYYFEEQHISQFDENFILGPFEYKHKDVSFSRFELTWFKASDKHAISKIFLGPKCSQNPSEVVETFERFGVQVKENQILKSESSYR